jgi:putative dimethyl sulfoxide reductase chaperone
MSTENTPYTDHYRNAVPRLRTYDLLAALYLSEPDAALVARLRDLPGFEDVVPPQSSEAEMSAWLEEQAAEYYRLFSMNAYPYGSIYLDRDLMLNTAASESAAAFYRECGFDPSLYSTGAPDHLGVELSLMSDLIAAERQAARSGDRERARWALEQQALLLDEHLARWAPVYARDTARVTGSALYRLAASLTVELILSDLSWLGETRPRPEQEDLQHVAASASTGGREQEDDGEGINRIVRRLVTPAEVGTLITRADIGALAREHDLPVPVGDRFEMMRSLLTAAGQFDCVPGLLASLESLLRRAQADLAEITAAYPMYASHARPWWSRSDNGIAMVADMRNEASALSAVLTADSPIDTEAGWASGVDSPDATPWA